MHEIKRSANKAVHTLLDMFPCVAILGARQVGKSTLARQIFPKQPFFDLERQSDYDRISRDPDFFLSNYNQPIVIDEAQELPKFFKALRVAIDAKRNKNGQYLITGSSSPALIKEINESLAGRVAVFELSGFSLRESWELPHNHIYEYIFNNEPEKILKLKPGLKDSQLFTSCFLGSYPEPFLKYKNDLKKYSIWMENYLQTYIKRDVRNLFPGINIETYHRLIRMLGASSGQILNASDFARSLDTSQPTIKKYFQIAHETFVWRILPSFQRQLKKRMIKMPKGHVRDTGLLNHILKNDDIESFLSHPAAGRIWETFISEQVIKECTNRLILAEPFYYRTSHHAEIDLILESKSSVIPIEVKFGKNINKQNIRVLQDFINELKLPFGIVINNAEELTWIADKILQIPASFL